MEENNNTNEKPVSAFGMLDADKTSNPSVDTETNTPVDTTSNASVFNQPADNNETRHCNCRHHYFCYRYCIRHYCNHILCSSWQLCQ